MENTIKERITRVIAYNKLSVKRFSEIIGMPQTTVNGYTTGSREAKIDFAVAILSNFENISAEWLMRGQGQMLRKPNGIENNISDSVVGSVMGNIGAHSTISNSMSQKNFSPNSSTEEKQSEEEGTIEQLKNEIRVKEEKIREMERTITSQEKTIIAQEKMISLLERNQAKYQKD